MAITISYKLEKFEGPLDLLLHLIEKNKIDIYDIPIVEVTNQYLDYVRQMEGEDLNVVSEFLVMAATLLDIKARMLLPVEVTEEGDEIDPRAELVKRLLEYKKYKIIAIELQDLEEQAQELLFKDPTIPIEVAKYETPIDLDDLLDGLTLARLQRVFDSIMKRQEEKIDKVRSSFGTIKKEPISLEERIGTMIEFAKTHRKFTFRQALEGQTEKVEIVVSFLAILELMKVGKLALTQEYIFDDIYIEALEALEAM